MKILLLISSLVALISIIVVFILVFFFSKRAIRPYMDNIERQKKFITDASHEIKTPLTSIVTSAEVLAMENGENEWVINIQNQIKRLSKLVENLVTLSRLDEGMPFPEQKEFSFSEAIWEIIEPFVTLAEVKHKDFDYHIEEGLFLLGDRTSVQQMISILLDNALKYSDENGKIWLCAYRKHRSIVLEVSNTCEGKEIPEPERLFDRFYRPDEARTAAAGGYGIGLSIAKAIAEAHHGRISVQCQNKKNIKFQIVI